MLLLLDQLPGRLAARTKTVALTRTFYLLASMLMAALSTNLSADDVDFTQLSVPIPFALNAPPIALELLPAPGKELIVLGMGEDREPWLHVLGQDDSKTVYGILRSLALPRNILSFDISAEESHEQELYLLTKTAIFKYSAADNALDKVQDVATLYKADEASLIKRKKFVHNINNDNVDDFVLQAFDSLKLLQSSAEGSNCPCWTTHNLDIRPRAELYEKSITFYEPRLVFADMNKDTFTDTVEILDGQLRIFLQNSTGSFNDPYITELNTEIKSLEWWEVVLPNGSGLDQSELAYRRLEDIIDINGDGINDLAVSYSTSSGVFDRAKSYEFYFGQLNAQGNIAFNNLPDTRIDNGTTLAEIKFIDLNNDERLEVAASSFQLSLRKVIGALLSGGIRQNYFIYALDDNNRYRDTPISRSKLRLSFSLSSGESGSPLMQLTDINGDQREDLVYGSKNKMRISLGHENINAPFKKQQIVVPTEIPVDSEKILADDINSDGKTDLVFHYGRQDDAEMQRVLRVLLSR